MDYLQLVVSTLLSAFVSFPIGMLFERRKHKAQADAVELDNVEKGIAMYRKMLEDAREHIDRLDAAIERLEARVDHYKGRMSNLETENAKLKARLENCKDCHK